MPKVKLYLSEKWLRRQYIVEGKDQFEIAKECGVSHMTIYRQLEKYDWYKKR